MLDYRYDLNLLKFGLLVDSRLGLRSLLIGVGILKVIILVAKQKHGLMR